MNGVNEKVQADICAGDKVFYAAIVKRQKLIIEDLCRLRRAAPDLVDGDVLGSLYSLFLLMEDKQDAAAWRAAVGQDRFGRGVR